MCIRDSIKAANPSEGIKNIEAGLPNITADWNSAQYDGGWSANGAVYGVKNNSQEYNSSSSGMRAYFDASRSSAVYGKSSTVTPASTTLYPWVVAYVAAIPASTAQAAAFQQGLSGKADTSLYNLSTAGKALASGLGMPSSRYIDLTLGASGSTYTAPANGYISIICVQTASAGWIRIWTPNGMSFWLQQNASNYTMSSFIPVLKGVNVTIDYENVAIHSNGYFRFIYAEGAE